MLNIRQKDLIRFLKDKRELSKQLGVDTERDLYVPVDVVAQTLGYSYNSKESNYSNCPTLYKDVDWINSDPETDIIICKCNGYLKIAENMEDVHTQAAKYLKQAKRFAAKYGAIVKKAGLNHQLYLIEKDNDTLIETVDLFDDLGGASNE